MQTLQGWRRTSVQEMGQDQNLAQKDQKYKNEETSFHRFYVNDLLKYHPNFIAVIDLWFSSLWLRMNSDRKEEETGTMKK